MYQIPKKTLYPPSVKNVMLWDGECGFCSYWKSYWEKLCGEKVDFKPYQQAAINFPDIPKHIFKKAVVLIDTEGRIFVGPNAAYRAFFLMDKQAYLHKWYKKYPLFKKFSDISYEWIAEHRSFMFELTKGMFGNNPHQLKHYWIIYLLLLVFVILLYFL